MLTYENNPFCHSGLDPESGVFLFKKKAKILDFRLKTPMAEKFGGYRWVKEGYLDNRTPGVVVGEMTFASLGPVEFCLNGDFNPDIAGRIFSFQNSQFADDPNAASRLLDLASPQAGTVSSISFDPHPLLAPHPYIEWFSLDGDHYRIELQDGDARLLDPDEAVPYDAQSQKIRESYAGQSGQPHEETRSPDQEWF